MGSDKKLTKVVKLEILSCRELAMSELHERLAEFQAAMAPIMNATVVDGVRAWDRDEEFKRMNGRKPLGDERARIDTYRWAVDTYPDFATKSVSTANNRALTKFRNESDDVFVRHSRALATYRDTSPIYLHNQQVRLAECDGQIWATLGLFSQKNKWECPTQVNVRLDTGDEAKAAIVARIVDGSYYHGDSMLQSKRARGDHNGDQKWFLLLTYKFDQTEVPLEPERRCGVDLGITSAFSCAIHGSKARTFMPLNEIVAFQNQVRRRRKEIQRTGRTGSSRAGHGRKRMLRPIEHLSDLEHNFRNMKNHQYARQIVDFAVKQGAGIIVLENGLPGFRHPGWVWSDLGLKIEQKAAEFGIVVERVWASYTSQRCSKCGYIDKENRNGETFRCTACGFRSHADYNAARNLATPNIRERIKEARKTVGESEHRGEHETPGGCSEN